MFLTTKENWSVEAPEIYQKIKVGEFRYIMSILDDLQALYDNGWDASFDYKVVYFLILPMTFRL